MLTTELFFVGGYLILRLEASRPNNTKTGAHYCVSLLDQIRLQSNI